jgi:putative Mg2+ transporter-C (MgtC) family protein
VTGWLEGALILRLDLLLRLLLATLLGGVIGLEREMSGKPAGFRTNILICVGAALLTELSVSIARAADPATTMADPGRIAAQIVSGIGFLGAGTIIQSRGSVIGLTTAATLWVVAAIGIAVGAGAYIEAVGTTLLVVLALKVLGSVERRIRHWRIAERLIRIATEPDPVAIRRVEVLMAEVGIRLDMLEIEKTESEYRLTFQVTGSEQHWGRAEGRLLQLEGVRKVSQMG